MCVRVCACVCECARASQREVDILALHCTGKAEIIWGLSERFLCHQKAVSQHHVLGEDYRNITHLPREQHNNAVPPWRVAAPTLFGGGGGGASWLESRTCYIYDKLLLTRLTTYFIFEACTMLMFPQPKKRFCLEARQHISIMQLGWFCA